MGGKEKITKEDKKRYRKFINQISPLDDYITLRHEKIGKGPHKICGKCFCNVPLGYRQCWSCGADDRETKNLWFYPDKATRELEKKKQREFKPVGTDFEDDM